MSDVFDELSSDHSEVRKILTALEGTPDLSEGASEHALSARAQLIQRLVTDSSRHEAAEQMYFWPAVRRHLPDGDKLADEAGSQENDAQSALEELGKMSSTEPALDALIAQVTAAVRQHIAFEENEVWPEFRRALLPEQVAELGELMREIREHARR